MPTKTIFAEEFTGILTSKVGKALKLAVIKGMLLTASLGRHLQLASSNLKERMSTR